MSSEAQRWYNRNSGIWSTVRWLAVKAYEVSQDMHDNCYEKLLERCDELEKESKEKIKTGDAETVKWAKKMLVTVDKVRNNASTWRMK